MGFPVVFVFCLLFSKSMFPKFVTCKRKDPRPKRTVYKYESDRNKKCLSIGNIEIMSVVVILSSVSKAYTSLCRGLEYYTIFYLRLS